MAERQATTASWHAGPVAQASSLVPITCQAGDHRYSLKINSIQCGLIAERERHDWLHGAHGIDRQILGGLGPDFPEEGTGKIAREREQAGEKEDRCCKKGEGPPTEEKVATARKKKERGSS